MEHKIRIKVATAIKTGNFVTLNNAYLTFCLVIYSKSEVLA